MIARLSGRTALALSALALLTLVLVAWFTLLSPQRSKAAELDDQIAAARTQLALARAADHSPRRRASSVRRRPLETAMPNDVRMSEILRQLSWAAASAHVRIDGVSPQTPVPHSGYQAIPLSVTLKGRYYAISHFLRLLHTQATAKGSQVHASGRLFTVDNLQFSNAPDEGLIQAALTIDAFSYQGATATSSAPLDPSVSGSSQKLAAAAPASSR